MTLDATTQPGFSGPPRIELDGSNAGAVTDGLQIVAGAVTVRGLVINRFGGNGVFGGGTFEGNYIGTDSSGMHAAPNGGSGLFGGGIVGGSTASQRNVVSGNGASGIVLIGNGGRAVGNYVGVGADGATPVGNGAVGVEVVGNGNTVGGLAPLDRNVIANNTWGVVPRPARTTTSCRETGSDGTCCNRRRSRTAARESSSAARTIGSEASPPAPAATPSRSPTRASRPPSERATRSSRIRSFRSAPRKLRSTSERTT